MRSIVTNMVLSIVFTGKSKLTQKHGKRRASNKDTCAALSNVCNDSSMSSIREPQRDEATCEAEAALDLAWHFDLPAVETHNRGRTGVIWP